MVNQEIKVGSYVEFDSDYGPQKGVVTGLLPCLENGRQFAAIEIDHELDGIVFKMPIDTLKTAQETLSFIFMSGAFNAMELDQGDRRFASFNHQPLSKSACDIWANSLKKMITP
ncbi:hypothetical protein ACO0LF_03600 [Undibacterium sp. Di27W]|uniref:hypothetical protein n=1 Tax=Undibacterium sp. Di27W TaxID=3413036 RepID=UPI003BF41243